MTEFATQRSKPLEVDSENRRRLVNGELLLGINVLFAPVKGLA
jgi:hypothetical protein